MLHEGSHAVQYRKLGWGVEFHGPSLDFEDGKLQFVLGSVSPIRTNNYDPLFWQHGMVSIAGFTWVEHFTGLPDKQCTIQNDLNGLRSKLGGNEDMNRAVWYAEIMLEGQLSEPTFISQLEQACRDYEIDVYGTDEATTWGWREYRPEISGKRYCVAVTTSGYYGTLVADGDDLILLTEGEVLRPENEHRRHWVEVMTIQPQEEAQHVVQAWNEAARQNMNRRKRKRPKKVLSTPNEVVVNHGNGGGGIPQHP